MRFLCKCYSEEFDADTVSEAKRKASRIANNKYNAVDVFHVAEIETGTCATFIRVNKKAPNNTIKRGVWA